MSIATELTLLANSKQAIKNSINQKGGSITDSTPFADYSTAIDNLPSGGGSGNPLLESIDVSDFSGTTFNKVASYITDVTIPSGVTVIGQNAFQDCSSVTSINIPSGVTSIGNSAFRRCTSLASVNIPSGVTKIENYTFANCTALTSINIPSGVTSIEQYAFDTCSALTSVTIPSSVTSIGGSAFATCYSLTSINIPSGVTKIENYTFANCTALTSINIPSGVTSIGQYAFRDCNSLTYVIVNATTPPTLGYGVFNETNNCPIYVPVESVDAYKTASNWSTYADRIQAIPEDVKPAFKFTSSVDSSKDITVNCEDTATAGTLTTNDLGMSSQQMDEFKSAENTGSVEIGDCVKIYRATNCYTAKGISEVKLNEGLERIEDFAFGGMSALREITIPSTVTNISYQAFYADKKLDGITCLATTPPTLGSDVFGDTNNCPIYVPAESVDTYKTAWSQYADRIEPI